MGKRITRAVVSLVKRTATAISSVLRRGDSDLTPEQKARLEEMEKDYETLLSQRGDDPKSDTTKKSVTESQPNGHHRSNRQFTIVLSKTATTKL